MSLAGCESVEAMVEAVSSHAAKHPELSWVVGIGWDQSRWGPLPKPKNRPFGWFNNNNNNYY